MTKDQAIEILKELTDGELAELIERVQDGLDEPMLYDGSSQRFGRKRRVSFTEIVENARQELSSRLVLDFAKWTGASDRRRGVVAT